MEYNDFRKLNDNESEESNSSQEPSNGISKSICPFCLKPQVKFQQHLFQYHTNEAKVKEIAKLPVLSLPRKKLLETLRLCGTLLQEKKMNNMNLSNCDICLGVFSSLEIEDHKIACAEQYAMTEFHNFLQDQSMLLKEDSEENGDSDASESALNLLADLDEFHTGNHFLSNIGISVSTTPSCTNSGDNFRTVIPGKSFCPFCSKACMKLSRHMMNKHVDVAKVQEFMKMPKMSFERKKLVEDLKTKGNMLYQQRLTLIEKKNSMLNALENNRNSFFCNNCRSHVKKYLLKSHLNTCFTKHSSAVNNNKRPSDDLSSSVFEGQPASKKRRQQSPSLADDSTPTSDDENMITLDNISSMPDRLNLGLTGMQATGPPTVCKKNFCLYCFKPCTKVVRHFSCKHLDEPEVQELLKLESRSEERLQKASEMRKRGNKKYMASLYAKNGKIPPDALKLLSQDSLTNTVTEHDEDSFDDLDDCDTNSSMADSIKETTDKLLATNNITITKVSNDSLINTGDVDNLDIALINQSNANVTESNLGNVTISKISKNEGKICPPKVVYNNNNKNSSRFSGPTKREFFPCKHCQGTFKKAALSKHVKKCGKKEEPKDHLQSNLSLLPVSDDIKKLFQEEVLETLGKDETSVIVLSDEMIQEYGVHLFAPGRKKSTLVSLKRKIRLLAKFLDCLMDKNGNVECLKQVLHPNYLKDVLFCAKKMFKYNPKKDVFTNIYSSYYVSQGVRFCAQYLQRQMVLDGKNDNSIKNFLSMFEEKVWIKVSRKGPKVQEYLSADHPLNKTAEDVVNFSEYIEKESSRLREELLEAAALLEEQTSSEESESTADPEDFLSYLKLTLSSLLMLNASCKRDIENLSLEDYATLIYPSINYEDDFSETDKGYDDEILHKTLTQDLYKICKQSKGRDVTIYLTHDLKLALDLTLKLRKNIGVNSDNKFLFPRVYHSSLFCLKGSICLKDHVKLVEIKNGTNFLSSDLDKILSRIFNVIYLPYSAHNDLFKEVNRKGKINIAELECKNNLQLAYIISLYEKNQEDEENVSNNKDGEEKSNEDGGEEVAEKGGGEAAAKKDSGEEAAKKDGEEETVKKDEGTNSDVDTKNKVTNGNVEDKIELTNAKLEGKSDNSIEEKKSSSLTNENKES